MTGRKYSHTDTLIGWGLMIVSFIVYLITLEPAVSFWDCPEYVVTAYRLEVGHPPGNPTFSLVGRVFITLLSPFFSPAVAVNVMSALFSALTVMLLYWSITIMLNRLLESDRRLSESGKFLVSAGCGISGALMFAFSDSFWYSAVEAEVYAFSSLCTALVVWVMLRQAVMPREKRSDAYLILCAYLTGLSLGVHELNLLCIPVLALIMLYSSEKRVSVMKLISVLLLSLLVIACILFGMVPGILEISGMAEILAVNILGLPLNTGIAVYALLLLAIYIYGAWSASKGNILSQRISLALAVTASGFLFFGRNIPIWAVCTAIFIPMLFVFGKLFTRRVMSLILWCGFALIAGVSVYMVIPVRASANPPVNTGNPSDVFAFDAYFSREQYGSRPLLYGRSPNSQRMKRERYDSITGTYDYSTTWFIPGRNRYQADSCRYLDNGPRKEYRYTPELDMVFPRLAGSRPADISAYADWTGMTPEKMIRVRTTEAIDAEGNPVAKVNPGDGKRHYGSALKPTQLQNLTFFGGYQVGYMYLRYLMWNFSGRQNDTHSQGQVDAGNFITGFSAIDDMMLGSAETPDNRRRSESGRHTYFLIPFLFALGGIIWLGRMGRNGRRASFTIATLFIMTGLAIVVYLNQTPCEPRERDYAFAGSYYAFAFWAGCGTGLIASMLSSFSPLRRYAPTIAAIIGLFPGILMATENFHDHDRSGRTATSDFAAMYMESMKPDAIVFVNGDNYTFPLWHAQEAEGIRRDVRIVNLAYLITPWYSSQLLIPGENSDALPLTITSSALKRNRHVANLIPVSISDTLNAVEALRALYASDTSTPGFPARILSIPAPGGDIYIDLKEFAGGKGSIGLDKLMMLDIIATNAQQGWKRPVYFMPNLPSSSLLPLPRHISSGPMLMRISPDECERDGIDDALEAYRFFTTRKAWGGMDRKGTYADRVTIEQTAILRRSILRAASTLLDNGDSLKASRMLNIALENLRRENVPLRISNPASGTFNEAVVIADIALRLAKDSNDSLHTLGMKILEEEINFDAENIAYLHRLPKRLQSTVSPATKLRGSDLPRALDLYRKYGGNPDSILRRYRISSDECGEIYRSFYRREALRRMLNSDIPSREDLNIYLSNGGDSASLASYPSIAELLK